MVQVDVKQEKKNQVYDNFVVSFDYEKTPITQIADYIIITASQKNASDIHFDPREDGMMVRFRIDGECQDYTFVPLSYEKNLITRLKLLANMNITETRLPQDGSIKGIYGGQYLDMRVSSLPVNEGEKIVIRILDYTMSLHGVSNLGFHPKNLEKVRRMMEIPNGIILATGATGSGKTTTTYSILQELNHPETNIITVEDPIEMNIEGINQVQVNPEIGMSFATVLRSILRQDPNIILIGEIRDTETAQIAVRASITGHLVLSTLHTNNTLSTVERLLDMDVERYLLSSALTGIISQRLAKRICPDCRYQRETTSYEKKVFKKFMKMDVNRIWDANPKGCPNCRKGYRGRLAFQEVLEFNDDIRFALNKEKLDKKAFAKMVYGENTITLLQDALIKCLDGLTSFEEVYRTIEIENEDEDNYENEMVDILSNAEKVIKEKEDKEKEKKEKEKGKTSTFASFGSIFNKEKEKKDDKPLEEIGKNTPVDNINAVKDDKPKENPLNDVLKAPEKKDEVKIEEKPLNDLFKTPEKKDEIKKEEKPIENVPISDLFKAPEKKDEIKKEEKPIENVPLSDLFKAPEKKDEVKKEEKPSGNIPLSDLFKAPEKKDEVKKEEKPSGNIPLSDLFKNPFEKKEEKVVKPNEVPQAMPPLNPTVTTEVKPSTPTQGINLQNKVQPEVGMNLNEKK